MEPVGWIGGHVTVSVLI